MLHKTSLVVAILLALAPACSNADRTKKLAALCVEAGRQLETNSPGADAKTFELMLANAFESCSAACDGDDAASCKHLDEHVAKVCKVAPEICASLCKTVKSPSLKARTCKAAT
jgi:hypothetical protein